MTPIYIGYDFEVSPLVPGVEIMIAELGARGFESFVENEKGLSAYIQKDEWHEAILEGIFILDSEDFKISYTFSEIEQVNWNIEWEKNFPPIVVDDACSVIAPFHDKIDTEYQIIIEPKMSFGTGHHATTHMMIQHLLQLDLQGKKALDMGCGTGVLAILAEMRGAAPIDAIDIDNWCYINSKENIERNNCSAITVFEGDSSLLSDKTYDLIIANINRNILLNDMQTYVDCLLPNGELLLSGFYQEDLDMIKESCISKGLTYKSHLVRDNWVAAYFVK